VKRYDEPDLLDLALGWRRDYTFASETLLRVL
jgi:hypothetical protein